MRTTVAVLPHDLAVKAALETIPGDHPVGLGAAPDGALEGVRNRTGPDYLILYPLNTVRDGSLADPFVDIQPTYQVTVVGRLFAGVRWLVDQIEPALLDITIAGRVVTQVIPEDDGQVRTDNDVTPPVFIATPRYSLPTVPA